MMNRGKFFKTLLGSVAGAIIGPTAIEKFVSWLPAKSPVVASTYDPMLISLVRKAMPTLAAYDICSVQPMTLPTGLLFTMDYRYYDAPKRLYRKRLGRTT